MRTVYHKRCYRTQRIHYQMRLRLSKEGEIEGAEGIRRDFVEGVGGVPNP